MKKYLKIFLSLIMVFALTGCVKYNVNMEVKKDKSVTLEVIYAIDTSYAESFTSGWETEENDSEEYEDIDVSEDLDETKEIDLYAEEDDDEEDISTIGANSETVKKEDYEWLEKKGYKVCRC